MSDKESYRFMTSEHSQEMNSKLYCFKNNDFKMTPFIKAYGKTGEKIAHILRSVRILLVLICIL